MDNIKRYFMEVAYDGSRYHGWQLQKNADSVQGAIQNALTTLLKLPVKVMGSGRTDTGVHARQQFLHFDFAGEINGSDFLKRINGVLPSDIAAFQLLPVLPNAHARFDARWRKYEYHISYRKDPFEFGKAWHCYYDLDLPAMQSAGDLLLKHSNFQCFSRTKTGVKSFDCKIKSVHWEQKDHGLIFHIEANRFLRGMVRAIMGTLLKVGRGMVDNDGFEAIIKGRDRRKAGSASPPQGLYLTKVTYPEEIFI